MGIDVVKCTRRASETILGSDWQNPGDLGGEVEFFLEDEKYLLTKSCLIFVPNGLRHCPLTVRRVDRPILFLAVSVTSRYVKENIIRASS